MTKESFAPRKNRKQLNMFYVKHTLLVISETLNEGGCISDNESTTAF